MGGQQKTTSNVNKGTQQAHQELVKYLTTVGRSPGGYGGALFPQITINQEAVQPYLDWMSLQNKANYAQAKESAGNLTGSGLEAGLGRYMRESNVAQGAFIADLWERRRQQDADRMMQILLGGLGSPAGGVTTSYQPGFLDYLGGAVAGAAPGIGSILGGRSASRGASPAVRSGPYTGALGPYGNYG